MKETTRERKKAIGGFMRAMMVAWLYRILCKGKEGFDVLMTEIGRMVVEVIMYIDREEVAGLIMPLFRWT